MLAFFYQHHGSYGISMGNGSDSMGFCWGFLGMLDGGHPTIGHPMGSLNGWMGPQFVS